MLIVRFLNKLKKTVKNRSRVEGSICEAYLVQEMANFCSVYFEPDVPSIRTRVHRNEFMNLDDNSREPSLSIFISAGRTTGKCTDRWLTDREVAAAQLHVLLNCDEVKPALR